MNDWPHSRPSTLTYEKPKPPRPLSLSDEEMKLVTRAAASLNIEKRDTLLRRLAAELEHRTKDVRRALDTALRGLHQGEQGAGDAA